MTKPLTHDELRAQRIKQMQTAVEADAVEQWRDRRFGVPLQTGGTATASLRPILENPDDELLLEVARRGDTPAARADARRILTGRKISETCEAFERAEPTFYAVEANYSLLFSHVVRRRLPGQKIEDGPEWALIDANQLTVPALQESYRELRDAGQLIVPRGTARPLTPEALDRIRIVATTRGPDAAIERYFRESFGGRLPDGITPLRLIEHNPQLASAAARLAFEAVEPSFQPSVEWESYLAERTRHRPVTIVPVLQALWAEFMAQRGQSVQQSAPPQPARRIEDASDAEIADALAAARAERLSSRALRQLGGR